MDILIIDLMLPGMDGLVVLSRPRRELDMYVSLLTVWYKETDKIVDLSVGADDYMTKPFSPRVLTARVKAAMHRLHTNPVSRKWAPSTITWKRRSPASSASH